MAVTFDVKFGDGVKVDGPAVVRLRRVGGRFKLTVTAPQTTHIVRTSLVPEEDDLDHPPRTIKRKRGGHAA